MSTSARYILFNAAAVALLSLAVTLSLAKIATIYLGGSLEGTGLIVTIICPLVIAGPASAWHFYQHSRLRDAHNALDAASFDLEQAHSKLQIAYRELDKRARHDGLTQILNREAFMAALQQMLSDQHGTLFICDADEFKGINDRYGHPVGDEALRNLALAIKEGLREGDIFGQIGGEEFAIFKPYVHGVAASEAADRMRLAVRAMPIVIRPGETLYITISIGGADSRHFDDLDALWRGADARLYAAKTGGRNRAVLEYGDGSSRPEVADLRVTLTSTDDGLFPVLE